MPATKTRKPLAQTIALTEPQAEAIEQATQDGRFYVPPRNLRGSRFRRDRADALVAKGILNAPTHTTDGSHYTLTEFGREVYAQHPKVIRRLPDDKHPAICPCRAEPKEN